MSTKLYAYELVTKNTRVDKWGSPLKCPHCDHVQTVYHLAWVASECSSCKTMVDKFAYSILKKVK